MDILYDIINSMDKHAAKQYKVFAGRATKSSDRTDFKLFDLMRKQEGNISEDVVAAKFYGTNRNAYYRLKNRLLHDVTLSVFIHRHENNDIMYAHYLVAVAHYFSSSNLYKAAHYFFKKAESVARERESYSLLDIIYAQMIKLARELGEVNPEELINKRKINRVLLNRIADTEDMLELLEYKVKWNQNLVKQNIDVNNLLKSALDEYMVDPELQNSPRFQMGVYFIISRDLLQKNDFKRLESYLKETLDKFNKQKLFNQNNHQHKLQMIAWLANAAFKNGNYADSLKYSDELETEMLRFDKLYYAAFEFFYFNIRVINYSITNPAKAIDLLESLTHSQRMLDEYGIFILFNLSLLYYQQRNLKKAVLYLNKLYLNKAYEKMEPAARLNANIGELLIRYDMHEYDIAEYRLKQIYKEHDKLLRSDAVKEAEFLEIFQELIKETDGLRKKDKKEKIEVYLTKYQEYLDKEESLFAYGKWLKEFILR